MPGLAEAAFATADDLLAVGRSVPAHDWLIVGGSLARGEPSYIPADGERHLLSDVDFLYVYSALPSLRVAEFMNLAEKSFTAVELMTLSLRDYRTIRTSLGHDFKNIGLAVTDHGLPEHDSVEVETRDAYEILLFYTQAYFWSRIHDQWQAGIGTTLFHLTINRLCIKVLRATAMLDGAYAHHDFDRMPAHLAERMRAELAWRSNPMRPPMDPGRFWTYLYQALAEFDRRFGHVRKDAVTGTRYAATSSGRIIARHHETVHDLMRPMAEVWHSTEELASLTMVKRQAWERITGWTGSLVLSTPETYFRRYKQDIHDHLLAMKVQAR
ncbi:hypothetical protein [Nocardia terpenica]|uniref:Nucleotidyltransferase domain-containing protein n=1 Tax=Nocardia terpenica TaxID=455432 RepID=A0A291RJA6_9NOCA|nr:hypothetical protein [Nocardia terpenica]ATL67234.1 hypothetical protein CRH09_14550 [Nocardia terpenica]